LEDHDDLLHKMTAALEKQEKVMEVLTQKIILLESHDNDNGEWLNNHSYCLGCLELPQPVRELRSNPLYWISSSFRLLVFHLPWSMAPHCLLVDGCLLLLLLVGLLCLLCLYCQAGIPALVVSVQVKVVIKEVLIVVIVTVVLVVMPVGFIASLPVL
jgi:hypothetical protein